VAGAGILVALSFVATVGKFLAFPGVPVVSLKPFIKTSKWQLDVAWTAKDAEEGGDFMAKTELFATARYILAADSDNGGMNGSWNATEPSSGNGTTIHGCSVIPFLVPPFGEKCGSVDLRKTRLGVQYVLQPYDELAALKPMKR
jgi:hypothetical protein